jgi:hypothetical protein
MRAWVWIGLCGVLLTVAGCGSSRTIGDVLADPGRYRDQEVRLEGQVLQSYAVLGQGAYRIEDATGRIWVVSRGGVPAQGARVRVEGRVQDGFALGGIIDLPEPADSGIVLLESSHEVR